MLWRVGEAGVEAAWAGGVGAEFAALESGCAVAGAPATDRRLAFWSRAPVGAGASLIEPVTSASRTGLLLAAWQAGLQALRGDAQSKAVPAPAATEAVSPLGPTNIMEIG